MRVFGHEVFTGSLPSNAVAIHVTLSLHSVQFRTKFEMSLGNSCCKLLCELDRMFKMTEEAKGRRKLLNSNTSVSLN
jgi:hypothetical protein